MDQVNLEPTNLECAARARTLLMEHARLVDPEHETFPTNILEDRALAQGLLADLLHLAGPRYFAQSLAGALEEYRTEGSAKEQPEPFQATWLRSVNRLHEGAVEALG